MNLDNVAAKSRALFNSFCDRMSTLSLREAVALPAAVGVCAVLYGIGVKPQGYLAVQAYKAMTQAGSTGALSQYVSMAGASFVAAKAAPMMVAACALLAGRFQSMRDFVSEKLKSPAELPSHGIASTFGGTSLALQSVKASVPANLDNEVLARIAIDQGKDIENISIGAKGAVYYRDGEQLFTLCQKGSQYWNEHEAKVVTQRVIGQPIDLSDEDDHGSSMRPS